MVQSRIPHVLVVDNEPAVGRLISFALRERGWETETASDGVEGLAKALDLLPDLIISDIEMPRMSGLNLLREIRHNISLSTTPVIMMSAGGIERQEESREYGANAFFSKPFAILALCEAVEKVMKGEQLL